MAEYLNRRGDGAIYAPSLNKNPRAKRSWGNAYFSRPVLQWLRDSVVRQVQRVSPVVVLGVSHRPSAVTGRVVTININPVDGASVRSITHVGQEVFKLSPSVTHRDTTTTVLREAIGVWIGAAVNHCTPRFVNGRPASAVRCGASGAFVSGKASTGLLPLLDVVAGNDCGVPAITKASPFDGNACAASLCYVANDKPAKSLTAKVNGFSSAHSALLNVAHLMVHGRSRCGLRSGATLAMQGAL